MADRSFEQQVHEELAGLRIRPDDAVWTGIEAALQKGKKRRFLWLFFLFAGLTGTGLVLAYLQWGTNGKLNKTDHSATVTQSANHSKTHQGEKTYPQQEQDTVPLQKDAVIMDKHNQQANLPVSANRKKDKDSAYDFSYAKKKRVGITFSEERAMVKNNHQKIITEDTIMHSLPASIPLEVNWEETKPEKGIEKQKTEMENGEPRSLIRDTLSVINRVDSTKKDSTITGTKSKLPSKKSWQWSIYAGVGHGNTINGLRFASKNVFLNTMVSMPGGGSQSASIGSAPVIRGALSFQAGVEISRPVGIRNRLDILLGYRLYQTNTQTGNRIDSTTFFSNLAVYNNNRYFYATGSTNTYHANYHLLDAGAGLYIPRKLFHAVPVRWHFGLGMQLLIATNSLLYDATSGKLFQNNALLAKFQPQVSAGFDIGMGKSSPVYLGPSVQYTLNKLSSSGAADKHLFFVGAKLSFLFPEKKKKMQR